MILTVMTLGSTMLGITAIAGLLLIYQIRQSADLSNSAKAIFAADTGIEWVLYDFTCHLAETVTCPDPPTCGVEPPGFADIDSSGDPIRVLDLDDDGVHDFLEASYRVRDNIPKDFCIDDTSTNIRSVGTAGKASRAFELAL